MRTELRVGMQAMVPTASDDRRRFPDLRGTPESFDMVNRDMPSSRPNGRRRVERRQARSVRRARRLALLVLLAAVFLVALLLTAFSGTTRTSFVLPKTPLVGAPVAPSVEIVALRGQVRLQLPVAQARVTAIGYSAAQGALALSPVGHQANQGLVQRVVHGIFGGGGGTPRWYQLGGGGTSALDVGATAGTVAYAPVDGTISAIQPYIIEGKRYGSEIDIQPQATPSLDVVVTQLVASPSLKVGSAVVSGTTQLGTIVDLASVERQALARYTNDAGNHVTIEVRAAPLANTG